MQVHLHTGFHALLGVAQLKRVSPPTSPSDTHQFPCLIRRGAIEA